MKEKNIEGGLGGIILAHDEIVVSNRHLRHQRHSGEERHSDVKKKNHNNRNNTSHPDI